MGGKVTAETFGETVIDVMVENFDEKGKGKVIAENFGEKRERAMGEHFDEKESRGKVKMGSLQSLCMYGYLDPVMRAVCWWEKNKSKVMNGRDEMVKIEVLADDKDFNEKKDMPGTMTFTEEQLKAIVQQASEVGAERTANACKDKYEKQLVEVREEMIATEKYWMNRMKDMENENELIQRKCGEYEKLLARVNEEKIATEKYWTDRMRDMEEELNRRKRASGGATRILQLEAKVKKLEAENMALECELGEVLEMLSDHESEEEEVELEEEEMSDGDAEDLMGKEKEGEKEEEEEQEGKEEKDKDKDKKKKKKYSWDAQKAREEMSDGDAEDL